MKLIPPNTTPGEWYCTEDLTGYVVSVKTNTSVCSTVRGRPLWEEDLKFLAASKLMAEALAEAYECLSDLEKTFSGLKLTTTRKSKSALIAAGYTIEE